MVDLVRSTHEKANRQRDMVTDLMDRIGVSLLASVSLSLIFYPFDTIKRCLQLDGTKGFKSQYKGSMDAA